MVSSVSSLTRSLSMASINSFNSAKAMLSGSPHHATPTQREITFAGSPATPRRSLIRTVFGASDDHHEGCQPLSPAEEHV
jgi:hypothetical protein